MVFNVYERVNGSFPFSSVVLKEAQSRYLELFSWTETKLPLKYRKPENNSTLKLKSTNEIMISHKGKRMVKDGED